MLRQTEDGGSAVRAGVGTDTLKDAGAVMKTVGQNMNLSLIPRDQFPVEPDGFHFLKHGVYLYGPAGRIRLCAPADEALRSVTLSESAARVKGAGPPSRGNALFPARMRALSFWGKGT